MYGTKDISNAFLDIDRAESVFELFFVFVRDEGSAVQDEQTFESAMRHIVGGVHLPEEALERVRVIYDRTTRAEPELFDSAVQLRESLSTERPLLVVIFSVLLRLAMDEGMMCQRDRERLTEVFQVFMFTPKEMTLFPDELISTIEYFLCTNDIPRGSPRKSVLSEHFEVLECTPESSSEEVRSSYRRLVKRYHPDRHTSKESDAARHRKQFEKVQRAYETITQAAKIQ
ncbi:J domain-containing protein [bacterium]|nr:J domain-containing protein [bacterium]